MYSSFQTQPLCTFHNPPTSSQEPAGAEWAGATVSERFEALLHGDTIVGLIHTIPTRGGTSRESS